MKMEVQPVDRVLMISVERRVHRRWSSVIRVLDSFRILCPAKTITIVSVKVELLTSISVLRDIVIIAEVQCVRDSF